MFMVTTRIARRGPTYGTLILYKYDHYKRVCTTGHGLITHYMLTMTPEQMKAFKKLCGAKRDADLYGMIICVSVLKNKMKFYDSSELIDIPCKVKKLETIWVDDEDEFLT